MSDYFLPDAAKAIIRTMGDKYPELRKGTDDDRRAFTLRTAEQIRFTCGPAYGTKRADPGRPPSKDAIAFKPDETTLVSWDIVNGSTRDVVVDSAAEDITGQTFMEVSAVDHLSGDPVQPGPVDPQKPQPGNVDDMVREFLPAAANSLDVLHVELRLIGQALGCMDDQGNPSYVNKLDIIAKQVTDLAHASPATPGGFNLTPEMLADILPVLQPLFTTAVATWLANNNVARVTVTPKK